MSNPQAKVAGNYCMIVVGATNDTLYVGSELLEAEHAKTIDGTYIYYRSGFKFLEEQYANRKKHGPFTLYYPDGNIQARGYNVHGFRKGYYIEYSKSGDPERFEFFP